MQVIPEFYYLACCMKNYMKSVVAIFLARYRNSRCKNSRSTRVYCIYIILFVRHRSCFNFVTLFIGFKSG